MPSPTEAAVPTSPAREHAEQARWRLRDGSARAAWFTRLIDAEFDTPAAHAARISDALRRMLAYAVAAVPWYRRHLATLSARELAAFTSADLSRLPILDRLTLRDQGATLRAAKLPHGERLAGATRTSGTTGQPVEVWHTENSLKLQTLLGQRQLRWWRFDPGASQAAIKLPSALPRTADNRLLAPGESLHLPAWPPVGSLFETGPFHCFASTTPIDEQFAWLQRTAPAYLTARAAVIEHLAFAARDLGPLPLAGMLAIADEVTPGMRQRIEDSFDAPLHQNYGLNEFGLVAVRCAAGGRYHVHAEHCVHEIVDEAGAPCRAGERGRLLLSCLSNPAMPLLRYDTGDLAIAADDPCPCGRTLPAFTALSGRRLHLAVLPPDTYRQREVLHAALEELPASAWCGLRQYQLRHARDGSFTLVLAGAGPPSTALVASVERTWAADCAGVPLRIEHCAHIETPSNGKFQEFVSDYFEAAD